MVVIVDPVHSRRVCLHFLTLLDALHSSDVAVVATTSDVAACDDAALRNGRLARRIEMRAPTREHARAIAVFQAFVAEAPRHPRVPDALLSMATSQTEMRDTRAARQTLQALVKDHPDSEAARLGAQQLAQLR